MRSKAARQILGAITVGLAIYLVVPGALLLYLLALALIVLLIKDRWPRAGFECAILALFGGVHVAVIFSNMISQFAQANRACSGFSLFEGGGGYGYPGGMVECEIFPMSSFLIAAIFLIIAFVGVFLWRSTESGDPAEARS